jgi:hypothetical protein
VRQDWWRQQGMLVGFKVPLTAMLQCYGRPCNCSDLPVLNCWVVTHR